MKYKPRFEDIRMGRDGPIWPDDPTVSEDRREEIEYAFNRAILPYLRTEPKLPSYRVPVSRIPSLAELDRMTDAELNAPCPIEYLEFSWQIIGYGPSRWWALVCDGIAVHTERDHLYVPAYNGEPLCYNR